MKKYNILIVLLLCLFFVNCTDTKNAFEIDSKQLKQVYRQNETVNLTIDNIENEEIESVIYYANDVKIGKSDKNSVFKFNLRKVAFGIQNIKAVVLVNGENIESFTSFEVVSDIVPKISSYILLNTFPHDANAYTQGLEFYNQTLLEGTGQNGESTLRKTNYKTGKVDKSVAISSEYFGEGITVFNNKIYQLTWQNKTGFIYNATTFEKEKNFTYYKEIEGWGLTHNNKHLIMSDGTNTIHFLDPETQKLIRTINVYADTNKIDQINELEFIDGKIWANIYQKDSIIIINPENGAVENVIDFSDLKTKITNPEKDVLNGIAYNPKTKTIFVTGKNWEKMFEIKLK